MNFVKVRTIHRRLGITLACFLLVQALAGMFMSLGRLASVDTSRLYGVPYALHADWDPVGSLYRVVLGLATGTQVTLGITLFLGRRRFKAAMKVHSSGSSPGQPDQLEREGPTLALSFAADILPLFRDIDIEGMKPNGIDLSSYENVKKRATHMYRRLSAREMPCDEPWSDSHLQTFKDWIESGMRP